MSLILFFLQYPGTMSAWPRWNGTMTPVGSSKLFVEWEVGGQRIKMKVVTATSLCTVTGESLERRRREEQWARRKVEIKWVFFSSLEEEPWGQFKTQAQFCNCLEHLRKLLGNTPSRSIHLLSFLLCFPSLCISNPQHPSFARNQCFFLSRTTIQRGKKESSLVAHRRGWHLIFMESTFLQVMLHDCVPIYLSIHLSKYILTWYPFVSRTIGILIFRPIWNPQKYS